MRVNRTDVSEGHIGRVLVGGKSQTVPHNPTRCCLLSPHYFRYSSRWGWVGGQDDPGARDRVVMPKMRDSEAAKRDPVKCRGGVGLA